MFSFLTLDQSTLFYWTLSDVPSKMDVDEAVGEWASAVTTHIKSTLEGPKSSTSRRSNAIPPLTGGPSRSSAASVLTNNIKVYSQQTPGDSDEVKIKAERQEVLSLSDEGGLSDSNELAGKERETAINSPLKGNKRITSEVRSSDFPTDRKYLKLSLSSNLYLTRRNPNQHPKSLETRNYPIGLKLNGSGTHL
jgi:hypothetical protein